MRSELSGSIRKNSGQWSPQKVIFQDYNYIPSIESYFWLNKRLKCFHSIWFSTVFIHCCCSTASM